MQNAHGLWFRKACACTITEGKDVICYVAFPPRLCVTILKTAKKHRRCWAPENSVVFAEKRKVEVGVRENRLVTRREKEPFDDGYYSPLRHAWSPHLQFAHLLVVVSISTLNFYLAKLTCNCPARRLILSRTNCGLCVCVEVVCYGAQVKVLTAVTPGIARTHTHTRALFAASHL